MSLKKISVHDYQIHVGDCLSQVDVLCESVRPSKVFVLVDENTEKCCLPRFQEKTNTEISEVITIPSGEKYKALGTCEKIWRRLFNLRADRKSLLINLGGGVIGDMGGFCASTYMRGIPFMQIPTTLLSQVDASIGGKLGIDYYDLKNSIGVFRNPIGVLIDPTFLQTLPSREIRSGYAETIKHGLIEDKKLWKTCTAIDNVNDAEWNDIILDSLGVKKNIVDKDPLEDGRRKVLNFGHTIGHAIESVMMQEDKSLLHGEAIAVGMVAEAYLSWKYGDLTEAQLEEITSYLISIYGQQEIEKSLFKSFLQKMSYDKKNTGKEINFTFLESIGKSVINQSADQEQIMESLVYYTSYQSPSL
ncbi:MAG: 3-dehydroquinate synthase [Saprospiraceae bacterium]|nr:3-dehydroquinate synthase [Saprospiraceae bacterium]